MPTRADDISETEFRGSVIDVAHAFGWRVAYFRAARTDKGWRTSVGADGKGYPDLTLIGPGGVLFRELKTRIGVLEPEQERWGEWLLDAGADWAVWRPADMPLVVATLSGGRGSIGGRR